MSRLGELRDYILRRQATLQEERKALHEQYQSMTGWRIFEDTPEEERAKEENQRKQNEIWGRIHELDGVLNTINQLAVHGFNEDVAKESK